MTTFSTAEIDNLPVWQRMKMNGSLMAINFDLTARCNNNCLHCYINLPPADAIAKASELTAEEINHIADQAVELGATWCLLTGGEPLLRPDFEEIYLSLKCKGLLVSVFTNATLINPSIAALFKQYPPRDIEVTVYGATRETYERISRLPGSYDLFMRGLQYLQDAGVRVRLKAMALKGNMQEMDLISEFCRRHSKDYYRFDPVLNLRYDRDPKRNADIQSERLSPAEIVSLEQSDQKRFSSMVHDRENLIQPELTILTDQHLFRCGIGSSSVNVGADGFLRMCSSLNAPEYMRNLRVTPLKQAITELNSLVKHVESNEPHFLATCAHCEISNLCQWCPAYAHLETGSLDGETPYFCQVAHARAAMIRDDAPTDTTLHE